MRYDALAGRVTSRLADPLLDAVGAGPGKRLLDIATGPGYVAARAADRGADPVGLDFSETMLAHARARSPQVEFVPGDATELPFADGSFDAVTCAFLLLHVGRPEAVVAEAARVLAPDGRAAFTVWDDPSRSRWLGVVLDASRRPGAQPPADVPPGPPMFQFADDAHVQPAVDRGGARGRGRRSGRVPARARKWRRVVDRAHRRQRACAAAGPRTAAGDAARDTHALRRAGRGVPDRGRATRCPVAVKLASGRKPA